MSRQQILERERRWARRAGFAAILAAPFFFAAMALDPQSGAIPFAGPDTERFRAFDEHAGQLIASSVLRAVALVLIVFPLLYLFRAAQARNERVSGPMLGFVFIGPLLLAVQGVVVAVGQAQISSEFVERADAGGDIYTLLEDLAADSVIYDIGIALVLPALLGLLVAMIYVPLQSMRAGLLTRFFATLGMALCVALVIIPPVISLVALMIWFGWLGFIFLDRVPKGRPPAWDAGVAIPWPKPGEQPAEPVPADGVVDGDAAEVFADADEPKDHSARRERAKKRKRKRRQ